jgi:hypothetical protein
MTTSRLLFANVLIAVTSSILYSDPSVSQVIIDIDANVARRAANETVLEDLSVNDTAYIYGSFCIKDNALYIPGWVVPANYSDSTYTASGVILQLRVLPGKRLSATYVDARQVQLKAQGSTNASSVLSKEEYNKSVKEKINQIFHGGSFFGTPACEEELKFNPLRKTEFFAIDSLNGHKKLSEALNSLSSTQLK